MNDKCRRLLEETSRTFFVPIMRMPEELQSAVGSAYLCLRAIDEIEDHPELARQIKIEALNGMATIFAKSKREISNSDFDRLLSDHSDKLPEVTMSISEVAGLAPSEMRESIFAITAEMAHAMAEWVQCDWRIETREDLDQYTFDVAGRVGILLSKIWRWYDGTDCNDELAVGFGRALQAVNIVRNREEDGERGISFFPNGWNQEDMIDYARKQMRLADEYMTTLPPGPIHEFCIIPLELARATLIAIENGAEKLNREDVVGIIAALELNMED